MAYVVSKCVLIIALDVSFYHCRFVSEYYSSLEQHFHADPLLLHDFIYLTRSSEYISLFQRIPTHLSLACLLSVASELSNFTSNKVGLIILTSGINIKPVIFM